MSQQRSCCCGVDQDFELECLHGDKLTPYGAYTPRITDNPAPKPNARYRSDAVQVRRINLLDPNAIANELKPVGVFPGNGQTIRYKTVLPFPGSIDHVGDLSVQGRHGLGLSEEPSTSGMGCMLCHGSLIMSFKAKRYTTNTTLKNGPWSCALNPGQPACDTAVTYYNSTGDTLPEEEPMHVLYTALKDVWYFERGPSGLPFTYRDETPPPYGLPRDTADLKYAEVSVGGNLGVRNQPYLESDDNCRKKQVFRPTPTDADPMCYPELTHCTNPANVSFTDSDGMDSNVGMIGQINKAWKTKCGAGHENRNPELANYSARNNFDQNNQNYVCTSLESNSHPWYNWYNEATNNNGCPSPSDQIYSPCYGSYQPGVSSWQMYQCRAQPYLRHLGDLLTYGNGIRTFRTPGPELFTETSDKNPTGEPANFDGFNGSNLFTNAYAGQFGRLFRCRVWVKADMFLKDGKFPCSSYGGEKIAYHPSKTNKKMTIPGELGGFNALQKKCSSGPAVLIYACSGVPVLSSDIRQLFDDGDFTATDGDTLLKIYLANNESGGIPTTPEWNDCFITPDIENKLGETGKFVAKDWRPDQLQKWDTLENQFQTITAEAIASGEIRPGDTDYIQALQYSQGVTLGQEIRDYITPIEVEDEDGNITLVEHELLPVQKSGREFLTFLINRAAPKQLAEGEIRGEGQGRPLLSEMVDYQATQYITQEQGFAIDAYDPWHPQNAGTETGWKPLGEDRGENYPISFTLPDGVTKKFAFRYPLRAAYRAAAVGPDGTSPYDPTLSGNEAWREIVPEWEEKLFEAWYKNNPIYMHSIPGGWSYSGYGDEHTIKLAQRWTYPGWFLDSCTAGGRGPHNLCDSLSSIHQLTQLEYKTSLGQYNLGVQSAFDKCDGFPNYTYMEQGDSGIFWTYGAQLRNKPSISQCRTIDAKCAPPYCVKWLSGGVECACDQGFCGDCCGTEQMGAPLGGNASCYSNTTGGCAGKLNANSGAILRNCCNVYNSGYSGRSANDKKIIGKATAGIQEQHPSSVSQLSSETEKRSWNNANPSQRMDDESLYGTRCSESGGCPPSYKCCCPSGCDGDCFCIPEKIECRTLPCSGQNDFQSPCCQSFGSCCYVDENGELKCIENISEEECVARKSIGGLDGTFNKNRECGNGPCNTTIVRGSCFYTDKLLDHQVCRDTTKETCAGLSGEFKENQPCSDFPDKITSAYETIVDKSGVKPQFPGDRSCGRFGFSVNCCTEEFDEATGTTIRTCEPKCLADCDIANGNSRIVSNCESCQPGEEGELGHCCTLHGYCKPNTTKADCWGIWGPGTECGDETCINQGLPPIGKIDLDLQYDSKTNWPDLANDVYEGILYKRDDEDPDTGGGGGVGGGVGGGAGGDGGGGGSDICAGCPDSYPAGPGTRAHVCRDKSAAMAIAGQHSPNFRFDLLIPSAGCGVKQNQIFVDTCVIKSVQVTKIGFRHVTFTSLDDDRGLNSGTCPSTFKPTGNDNSCCEYVCNPFTYSIGNCSADLGTTRKGLQDAIHALEVTVYPYKIRCQQTREVGSGFWKCGILNEFIPLNQITDHAIGVAGVQDWLTCHDIVVSSDSNDISIGQDRCTSEKTTCVAEVDDLPSCEREGGGVVVTTALFNTGAQRSFEAIYAKGAAMPGGFCPNYSKGNLLTAYSIPFPDQGNGEQYIYGPKQGIGYIPKAHCSKGDYKESNIKPRALPPGALQDCAEFYQDKLLCNIGSDNFYEAPPPYTDLIFHDYGGVTAGDIDHWMCQDEFGDGKADWFKGASAEYVDAFFDDSKNPNKFWIKKEFPSLQYIRLFGAGCYDIPGSFDGGRGRTSEINGVTYGIGGNFAGTMVLNFGSTAEFERFDDSYGAENLSLRFLSKVLNQPEANPIGGIGTEYTHTFIAQPSFNFYKEASFDGVNYSCGYQEDKENQAEDFDLGSCPPFVGGAAPGPNLSYSCSYKDIGWLNGRGLTYSNTSIPGSTAEYTGKVYEFCSFLDVNKSTAEGSPDDPNELGGQLKPIFQLTPPADNPLPHYSGVRGPLVLFARNEDEQSTYDMSVNLSLTSTPPAGGNTCGACYGQLLESPDAATTEEVDPFSEGSFQLIRGLFGQYGNPQNDDRDKNPRIKENCVNYTAINGEETKTKDWYSTVFIPGYSGITTGGAKGCCTHRTGTPLSVEDGQEATQQPCNQWQEVGEGLHENPARTYGQGDCTCDENP